MRAIAARFVFQLAVAAVVGGLLGMHVLNGHHAGHGASGASAGAAVLMDTTGHTDHSAAVHQGAGHTSSHSAAAVVVDPADAAGSCGCSTPCAEATEVHSPCVPLPNAQTLGALAGSALVLQAELPALRMSAAGGVVVHLPGPSLYELCVSRC